MHKMKVSRLSIATIALFVALFKPEGLPDSIRYSLQIGLLIIFILYFITKKVRFHENIMLYIIIPVCVSSIVSYSGGIISLGNLINCFYYMFCLWSICQLLQIWIDKGKYYQLLNLLQCILGVYCILSVISVFYVGTTYSATTTYLFGGKFITTYFFVLFLGLSYANKQNAIERRMKNRIGFAIKCIIVFAFEVYINCSTGMLIVIFLFILVIIPEKTRAFLTKKIVFVAAIIASGLIPIFINGILSVNVIQFFIVSILGKSLTLTDRLPIYTIYLLPLIRQRLLFGYGYASSIMHLQTGVYWNAQNGLLDILLNYGIIGGIGFLVTSFKVAGNENAQTIGWPFYVVLYSLMLAATIEVSYDMMFRFTLSLLFITQFVNATDK